MWWWGMFLVVQEGRHDTTSAFICLPDGVTPLSFYYPILNPSPVFFSLRLRKTRGRNTTWKESQMKCTQNISPVPSWVCPSLLFVSKWPLTICSLAFRKHLTCLLKEMHPTYGQHSGDTRQLPSVLCSAFCDEGEDGSLYGPCLGDFCWVSFPSSPENLRLGFIIWPKLWTAVFLHILNYAAMM